MVYYPDNLLVLWLFKDFRFFLLDLLQNLSELLTTFAKPHNKRGPVYFLANVGSEKFLTVSHQKRYNFRRSHPYFKKQLKEK